jgi:hypothetical protein
MSDTALKLTHEAARDFLERNKNLLALTREGAKGVMRRVEASLALLDAESKGDVLLYLDVVDQKGYAGQIARKDFRDAMYAAIAKSFLKAQRNLVIEFISKLTPEALAELESIEVTAGERQAAPPPPPQKSPQEQLEDQVLADYNGALSTDKMRAKMNSNAAYRDTFNRLSESGKLESRVTTLHDGGKL